MSTPKFTGADKSGRSVMSPLGKRLSDWAVPRLPRWLETYHLTMMTVGWCLFILLFSYLARRNIRWLWLVSVSILGQYLTDHLDGKLGKFRNTGLVRWGYVMDHFLDYFFLCSILLGYGFLLQPPDWIWLFLVVVAFGGFLILSYLAAVAAGSLRVSVAGMGPTEFRLAVIGVNALLIYQGPSQIGPALPYVAVAGSLGLIVLAYDTHRKVWQLDMECKAEGATCPDSAPR